MNRRLFWFMVMILAAASCLSQSALAQTPSEIDTFALVDTEARAGEAIPVELFVVNNTANLAAIAAYYDIDNSRLDWVGEWNYHYSPARFYVTFDTLPRAQVPGLFQPSSPLFMQAVEGASGQLYGAMVGAGFYAALPPGRGSIIQFYVRVKSDVPVGTEIPVGLFNPAEVFEEPDLRYCQYADQSGTITVDVTLVDATITVVETLHGDCDDNGSIAIEDAVYLVNYIFGGGVAPNPLSLGDVNCDEMANISDVVYLIDYIFGSGPAPWADCP